MPDCGIDAFTILDADGNYIVYINDKLSFDAQIRAYKHELYHINNGDFEQYDVQRIESQAHKHG